MSGLPSTQPLKLAPVPRLYNGPLLAPNQPSALPSPAPSASLPTYTDLYHDSDFDDDDEAPELPAPITVSIICPTKIVGHGNLVNLDDKLTPQVLTSAVVAALQQTCLVDEEGRARPLTLRIEAGVTLEGSRNIVGMLGRFATKDGATPTTGRKRRAESVSSIRLSAMILPC